MKRYLTGAAVAATITLALAFSPVSETPAPYPTAFELIQTEILNATVRVKRTDDEGKRAGSGSGTFITPKLVLTNHHVAGESGTHTICAWLSVGSKTYPVTYQAKVIAHDKDRDLALLEVDGEWAGAVAPLAAGLGVRDGDAVIAAGSPMGKRSHVTHGDVSLASDDVLPGLKHILATAQIAPGSSGGGLWRKTAGHYELVGVAFAVHMVDFGAIVPHMAYFIPLKDVREFLAANKVVV
jgi:S1-C subfamily serine protease